MSLVGAIPFDESSPYNDITDAITGMQAPYNISLYPGSGTVDGIKGDHILIAPAYNVTSADVHMIVDTTASVIRAFFEGFVGTNGA